MREIRKHRKLYRAESRAAQARQETQDHRLNSIAARYIAFLCFLVALVLNLFVA
jgi:hypothetical protein